MNTSALVLRGLYKRFGMTDIIRGLDLEVRRGERHALIGPNGAGKSTTFHLISGRLRPSAGDILLNGESIARASAEQIYRKGLARSFQITNLFPSLSVYENVRYGAMWRARAGYAFWRDIGKLRHVHERTAHVLEQIGLAHRAGVAAGTLSYAEQRALEIGVCAAGDSDVILLDEPTAGMSVAETTQAVDLIRKVSMGKTLLMVEHDMSVVFGLADRISVLVYGQVLATGTPSEIRDNPLVREAYLGEEVLVC
ncbi:MAG: ABC transporter ATP-binding protein [bacterium]